MDKTETIDVELFHKYFAKEFRKEMKLYRMDFLKKIHYAEINGDMGKFQCNVINYSNRHEDLPNELRDIDDLYPPNFAVLDFVLKNLENIKQYSFLDHGCGTGILSVYLKKLGIECFNYDNWSHFITKENAIEFLSKFNLQNTVIDIEEIKPLKLDVFCSIGTYAETKGLGTFEYIFSDVRYPTKSSEHIAKCATQYKNLITVREI